MIALDTNILVYAHRAEFPQYGAAYRALGHLAASHETWGIPWPCVHEFLAVVTNRKLLRPPTTLSHAIEQMEAWFSTPSVRILEETPDHWSVLRDVLERAGATGGLVPMHDASPTYAAAVRARAMGRRRALSRSTPCAGEAVLLNRGGTAC